MIFSGGGVKNRHRLLGWMSSENLRSAVRRFVSKCASKTPKTAIGLTRFLNRAIGQPHSVNRVLLCSLYSSAHPPLGNMNCGMNGHVITGIINTLHVKDPNANSEGRLGRPIPSYAAD